MDIDIVQQNLAGAALSKTQKKVSEKTSDAVREQQLKDACAGFEAILTQTMLKSMRSSLPGDALFEESNGMNIYKSMYDQYLSEEISKSPSSVGIKDFLYQQLKSSL